MNKELDIYYTERLSMMGTIGWNELMEQVQEMLNSTNNLDAVSDEKTLNFRKGEVSIMRWLLAQKDMTKIAFEELKNE
jgi:hypothetical protein